MKFTPGGGHIDLSRGTEGGEVVIDVRDTGIGIPAEQQDELFTRFFTARAAPRRARSAGLGLYIVKQIVDGHDGSVGAVSVQGHGSTFTMRLPARPNRREPRRTVSLIFIVDDDPDVREMVEYKLVHAGHEVLSAANGQDALRLVPGRAQPDAAAARRHDARTFRLRRARASCARQKRRGVADHHAHGQGAGHRRRAGLHASAPTTTCSSRSARGSSMSRVDAQLVPRRVRAVAFYRRPTASGAGRCGR